MNRSTALILMRVAGYHDHPLPVRTLIDGNLNMADSLRAMREGKRMRASGVNCDCRICTEKARWEAIGEAVAYDEFIEGK